MWCHDRYLSHRQRNIELAHGVVPMAVVVSDQALRNVEGKVHAP